MLRLLGHDIRTAVSDVIGGLRLVEMDRLDPDTQTQIDRVRIAGETLAELMDSALMAAAGEVPPDAPALSFEFRTFLAGIELRWDGRAREQGLGFRLEIDRSVPERIKVVRIKLDRILGNLIANALKHSDRGAVTLSISVVDDKLEFQVRDEGQGFSDKALEKLFSPDGRPEDSNRPGSGLGLHISNELAKSLGGDLKVENLVEGGAVVSLSLPRSHWELAEGPRPMPDLTGLSILVAEDNETNQILVRKMLERMGARMVLARDGVEALDIILKDRFDLALIDIEMPKKSGIDLMRELREGHALDTPLVALTAYVMRDNREAIYAAGADGIIGKPIRSVLAFGEAIRRHVDRNGAGVPDRVPNRVSAEELATIDRNRFEAILQATGPDDRREFLSHLINDLKSIEQTLHRSFSVNDSAETRAQTHILISLAGAIGAEAMQAMAESLNATAHHDRLKDAGRLTGTCLEALHLLIEQVEMRARREGVG